MHARPSHDLWLDFKYLKDMKVTGTTISAKVARIVGWLRRSHNFESRAASCIVHACISDVMQHNISDVRGV